MTIDTENCITLNEIKFCPIIGENKLIVGTNKSDHNNALSQSYSPTFLRIPSKVNSFHVVEVGQFSFYGVPSITQITIEEGIRQINHYAFYSLINLEIINLPSTVEYLGKYSISACEWDNETPRTSPGTFTVIFQPNSKLKYLDNAAIERKSNAFVYYCGYGNPQFIASPFYQIQNVTIYSFTEFKMNNYETKADYTICPMLQNMKHKTYFSRHFLHFRLISFLFLELS